MSETFYIGEDDDTPFIQTTLRDGTGEVINLSVATVKIQVWNYAGVLVVDAAATVVTPLEGVVRYEWDAAFTATPGNYLFKWVVAYGDGGVGSFPNDSFNVLVVTAAPSGYAITIAGVLSGFSTGAGTEEIAGAIAVVDQADVCLTNNAISPQLGRYLKTLGARHLLSSATSGGGRVKEEEAVSGARRVYADAKGGESGYMETLRTVDKFGCVIGQLNRNARVQFRSVGRSVD